MIVPGIVNGKPVKRYQAVWYENGREYRETFDTRELAQDKLDNVKKLLAQGQSPASLRERGGGITSSIPAYTAAHSYRNGCQCDGA